MHVDELLKLLPEPIRIALGALPPDVRDRVEEIRIREGRPLEIGFGAVFRFITASGHLSETPILAYRPVRADSLKLLDQLTNHSVYTMEEQLRRGFITVRGGHRVGLSGRVVLEKGAVKHIRDVTGFNVRIARQLMDVGRLVLPHLVERETESVHRTLIVSPPQGGKTTLARDLARLISMGCIPGIYPWPGRKVGIVDERSELAACVDGVPSFDVGPRTDVLDGCPKAEGMMMLIRSMSPEVIVVDEIGTEADVFAIQEALYAGVKLIATAHSNDLTELRNRPNMRILLQGITFTRFVVLRSESGNAQKSGKIANIYDHQGNYLATVPVMKSGVTAKC